MQPIVKFKHRQDTQGLGLDKLRQKKFEVSVMGDGAMFSIPELRGSNHISYSVPVVRQLEIMLGRIYQKPGFFYSIDDIRVMNEIKLEPHGATMYRGVGEEDGSSVLGYHVPLRNVHYKLRFHLEWNPMIDHYPGDFSGELDTQKQWHIVKDRIEKGLFDGYFGLSEYPAYLKFSPFDEGEGFYDNTGLIRIRGQMPLRIYEPEFCGNNEVRAFWWEPEMRDGVIHVPDYRELDLKDSKLIRSGVSPRIFIGKRKGDEHE